MDRQLTPLETLTQATLAILMDSPDQVTASLRLARSFQTALTELAEKQAEASRRLLEVAQLGNKFYAHEGRCVAALDAMKLLKQRLSRKETASELNRYHQYHYAKLLAYQQEMKKH